MNVVKYFCHISFVKNYAEVKILLHVTPLCEGKLCGTYIPISIVAVSEVRFSN
jgi:hypothetical protein